MKQVCDAMLFPIAAGGGKRPKVVLHNFLNRVDYMTALHSQREFQSKLIAQRQTKSAESVTAGHVFLLEHDPVYTFGKASQERHVVDKQIQAIRSERGGEVTYHGPGQLVAYLILDLEYFKKDLHCVVSGMERVVMRTLAEEFALDKAAPGGKGRTGVWMEKQRKIAAIGLSCKQWVTMHGLALNVNAEALQGFRGIVPCGLENSSVTSIQSELGSSEPISMARARDSIIDSLQVVFGMDFV